MSRDARHYTAEDMREQGLRYAQFLMGIIETERKNAMDEQLDTVDFVREWLMSSDHPISDWEREFAAAIDARNASPAAGDMDAKAFNMEARPDAGDEDVERVAQFLHDEGGFGDAMTDRTWPEHPDDTGQREGGWVKIVPADVQAKFRDVARRLLLPPSLAAMREGVDREMVQVPHEPTEAMLKAAKDAGNDYALGDHITWDEIPVMWRAMVKAATALDTEQLR